MPTPAQAIKESRKTTRKHQNDCLARIGSKEAAAEYLVNEISAEGFSFFCNADNPYVHKGVHFDKIAIVDSESSEIMEGSGTIVNTAPFGASQIRVGVRFIRKTLDRTIAGKIRLPRYFPKTPFDTTIYGKDDNLLCRGVLVDYTVRSLRVHLEIPANQSIDYMDVTRADIYCGSTRILSREVTGIDPREPSGGLVLTLKTTIDTAELQCYDSATRYLGEIQKNEQSFASYDAIDPGYKALIADWNLYTKRIKNLIDREEYRGAYPTASEQKILVASIKDPVFRKLDSFIEQLNLLCDPLDAHTRALYKQYYVEHLRDYLLLAPLTASAIERFNGYHGDFATIKLFFEEPCSGKTLFGKVLNSYIATLPALQAHLDRITFLHTRLEEEYLRCSNTFSVLVIGSGPAEEAFRFLKNRTFEKPVHMTLLDMDAYALSDFAERMQGVMPVNCDIDLINANVINFLRHPQKYCTRTGFNVAYCAGLFDYLTDTLCKRCSRFLLNAIRPGGAVFITNVHRRSFIRHYMDFSTDWQIILRNENEMRNIVLAENNPEFYHDQSETNMYVKLTKP